MCGNLITQGAEKMFSSIRIKGGQGVKVFTRRSGVGQIRGAENTYYIGERFGILLAGGLARYTQNPQQLYGASYELSSPFGQETGYMTAQYRLQLKKSPSEPHGASFTLPIGRNRYVALRDLPQEYRDYYDSINWAVIPYTVDGLGTGEARITWHFDSLPLGSLPLLTFLNPNTGRWGCNIFYSSSTFRGDVSYHFDLFTPTWRKVA